MIEDITDAHCLNNLKRSKYEDILASKVRVIFLMNLTELKKYKEKIKMWQTNLHALKKESGIKKSRLNYLGGLDNHVIRPLLTAIKTREKTLNRISHNGSNGNVQREFMNIAMEELPLWQFQKIYGLACEKSGYQNNIEDVDLFIKESLRCLE